MKSIEVTVTKKICLQPQMNEIVNDLFDTLYFNIIIDRDYEDNKYYFDDIPTDEDRLAFLKEFKKVFNEEIDSEIEAYTLATKE